MSTLEMSTLASGNTKTSAIKGRSFMLTCQESQYIHYEDVKNYLTNLKGFQYWLCCEHHNEDQPHSHIYVQFDDNKRLSLKKLKGLHLDKCLGSAQQCIKYLKCEDDKHIKLGITATIYEEIGEPLTKGGCRIVADIEPETDLNEIPIMYYNIAKKIQYDKTANIEIDELKKEIKVYWIQGPSGIGKTEKAKEIIRTLKDEYGTKVNMVKFENGFYIGVGSAPIAIYDDFRDSHMKPSEFINFIDYNKHYMNIKGGQKLNEYKLIIITTVQNLNEIYRNMSHDEPRKQWERRINVIDMNPERDENDIDILDI